MPKGASNPMRSESHTAPPCGAMESPQTVTTSDLAMGGTAASSRRIQRSIPGWGRTAVIATADVIHNLPHTFKKCIVFERSAPVRPQRGKSHVCADGRYRSEAAALARRALARGTRIPGAHRCRHQDRAQGLDAGGVSEDPDPADLAARALGDRRHAARRQLDHARPEPEAQGDPDGQGTG